MNTTLKLTGNGAIYKRVSTDMQEADRQDIAINGFLKRHNVKVPADRIFTDVGETRATGMKRPALARLLRLIDEGVFQWVLVDSQDRIESWSARKTQVMLDRFDETGCKLYDARDRDITDEDMGNALTTAVTSHKSSEEVREHAHRVLTDRVKRAKTGQWLGGKVPYGLDVVAHRFVNAELVEAWRVQIIGNRGVIEIEKSNGEVRKAIDLLRVKVSVDGSRSEYNGPSNFPAADEHDILQLRPTTDEKRLAIIREIFERFAAEQTTTSTIARELEIREVPPAAYAECWHPSHVEEILRNPVYIGRPGWNRTTSGSYKKWQGGEEVQKTRNEKPAKHAREDWILPKELFEAIVPVELYEKCFAKLMARPAKPRVGKNAGYLFSNLVWCTNCGGKMDGAALPPKADHGKTLTYLCGTYNTWRGAREKCPCKAFRVKQDQLIEIVQRYLDETMPHVESITASVKAEKPAAFKRALVDSMVAWRCMVAKVDVRDLDQTDDAFEANVAALYDRWFASSSPQARSRLDQLEADYRDQTLSLARVKSAMQREVIEQHLMAVELEIAQLRRETTNAADAYREASREVEAINKAWREATAAIEGNMAARRRAAAVAAVIERINVTCVPTGMRWPAAHVTQIEIIPRDPGKSARGYSESGSTTRSR